MLFTLLLLGLAGLVGRTSYFQVVRADEFAARARRQHFVEVTIPAVRGRILDRNGETLVCCYHSRSIAIDAVEADARSDGEWIPSWSARMALALGEPERAAEFAARIATALRKKQRFCYLARWVDRDASERALATKLPGLDVREEPRREYPHGGVAAAVLGVVGPGPDGRNAGLTGLEKACDAWLRGADGHRSVLRSGRREALHLFPEYDRDPVAGRDLVVTLDLAVQQIVEEELDRLQETVDPKLACAVVMDPRTGDLLAIAGRPAFDPDAFPSVDRDALRIPALHLAYEPGSTVKPFVMARGLTDGVVRTDQTFDCGPGYRKFGWRVVRDVKPNGELDTAHVLIKSSNTGMSQIGLALGVERVHDLLTRLRIGERTPLPFEFEEKGKVPAFARWKEFEHDVSVSFGRGFMLTPIQLARAYCALANGGYVVEPRLLRHRKPRPAVPAGLSRSALRFVRAAMVRVVEEGTGRRARVKGLAIGGKTGTSEHYPKGSRKYDSSFAGFAPADDPRLVVVVVAHDPKRSKTYPRPYGGVVAAPVVGRIFRRAIPLLSARENAAHSESGVRQTVQTRKKKVRVAAVQRSSVSAGERISPAIGRNPDSDGAILCRSDR
ncbi:MAG: peptidoglycan D,D-transpeptidase FtsI family protein [Planctomycetota bacterium]|jgi:cell division protein FtsI (penicillin-binding protein 3)